MGVVGIGLLGGGHVSALNQVTIAVIVFIRFLPQDGGEENGGGGGGDDDEDVDEKCELKEENQEEDTFRL